MYTKVTEENTWHVAFYLATTVLDQSDEETWPDQQKDNDKDK